MYTVRCLGSVFGTQGGSQVIPDVVTQIARLSLAAGLHHLGQLVGADTWGLGGVLN